MTCKPPSPFSAPLLTTDARLQLSPYVNQRLTFTAVVYTIYQSYSNATQQARPNLYEITLASLYANHFDLQLDHVVIQTAMRPMLERLAPFQVITFTSKVERYLDATGHDLLINQQHTQVLANTRRYSLTDLHKVRHTPEALLNRPELSLFVRNRLARINHYEHPDCVQQLKSMANDGSRERWLTLNAPDRQPAPVNRLKTRQLLFNTQHAKTKNTKTRK